MIQSVSVIVIVAESISKNDWAGKIWDTGLSARKGYLNDHATLEESREEGVVVEVETSDENMTNDLSGDTIIGT